MDTDHQDVSYPLQADEVLAEFQMTMARFLETQERVMLAYLGSGAGAAAAPRAMPRPARPIVARAAAPAPLMAMPTPVVAPVAAAAPAPTPQPVAAAVPTPQPVAAPAPAPAPVAAAAPIIVPTASAGLDRAGIAALLLDIVQDRTGYPADMLGLDQGIEADLGIDSIKRVEIIGALLKGLPGPQASAAQPMGETLNEQKTLGAIVEKLAAHLAAHVSGGAPASAAQGVVHGPFDLAAAGNAGEGARPPRYVMRAEAEALPSGAALPAGRYLVTEGRGGLAAALAKQIAAAGGTPVVLSAEAACEAEGPFAGLVHLAPTAAVPVSLDGDWRTALELEKSAYRVVRAHAEGLRVGRMVFASAMGGSFGREGETGTLLAGGCTGLAKSLREEWPAVRAKAIDLDPALADEVLAQALMEELAAPFGRQEVGYPGGRRMVFRSVQAEPEAAARDLPPGAVILATGGARGITAEILRPFAAAG